MIYKILTIACASLFWLQATHCYGQLTVKPVVTHASCNGGSDGKIGLQVTGTPPYTYEWSTGASTQDINELNAGLYRVKVKDARGNLREAQVQVQNRSGLKLEKKQMVIPYEDAKNGLLEVQVSGGRAPYFFFLSNYTDLNTIQQLKQLNGTFKGLSKGRYLVDVVDAKGCTASLSIRLK
jgi:hypothetical protein